MNVPSPFLSTLPPTRSDRRIAVSVLLISIALFVAAAPFAKVSLPELPAFLPLYQSAFVVNETITAVLLFGQYRILRSRALLVLASGYLFSAAMAVAHALTFPGLFAPAGLLGAGPQSTAWLYFLWHGGFPLFLVGYALLKDTRFQSPRPGGPLAGTVLAFALAALALAGALTLLATAGHEAMPIIMRGDSDASMKVVVATATWLLSLVALATLWRRRPHSVLDLWLMVVICVWIFDSALAAVLNHGRYDLGWYAGRIYGLLAGSFLLMVLLLENGELYVQLARVHARELDRTADLTRVTAELESANEQLAEKNRQLGEASRLKSEFLANMSHELRTPLNAIIGFSEVLRDGLLGQITDQQKEYVSDIFVSGRHLLALINDILDLSKIEAGKMALDLAPQDADDILRSSLSIVKEQAAARRILLEFQASAPLGTALLDERKLKQIVYNLLSNGVKFSQEGGRVALRVRRVARAGVENWSTPQPTSLRLPLPDGDCATFLEISVEDSGIGIAAEDAPRLFRAFSQLDSSLSRETEGTGLGLALVLKLAKLHGGTAALASEPGRGTTFYVWLPWRAVDGSGAEPSAPLPPTGDARPLALVIEDNDQAAELIRLQLEPAGFEVLRAGDAKTGLDLLSSRSPTIIILDILLPDVDGWELLGRIKQPGALAARIPVVIVSIVADDRKGFSLGASAVLQKPVARDELLGTVQRLTRERGGRPAEILVVDDDARAADLLAAYLAEPGYKVLRAYGGREGVDAARRSLPDLIVLDLMMPEVNGFDVVEALKRGAETADIPIVIVTAKTITAEEKTILNSSAAAILEKSSFNHGRFVSEVKRALAKRTGGMP